MSRKKRTRGLGVGISVCLSRLDETSQSIYLAAREEHGREGGVNVESSRLDSTRRELRVDDWRRRRELERCYFSLLPLPLSPLLLLLLLLLRYLTFSDT